MKSQRPAVIEILTTSIMARNQQPLTQSTWVVTSPSSRKRLYLKLPIVSPRTNTIASRDRFKPIRIGENLVVNYNG